MHNFNLYYWKDKQEVDIIIDMRKGLVPIGFNYTGKPLDVHDWEVKRFAFIVTLTKDWYDSMRNKPNENSKATRKRSGAGWNQRNHWL